MNKRWLFAFELPAVHTRSVVALAMFAICATSAVAQQPPARPDSVPVRADYRNLTELLEKLPVVSPPSLDESRALWLGALPLACMDRLQSRPGRGGGRASVVLDTSAAGRANVADSANRGRGRASGRGASDTASVARTATDSAGRGGRGNAGGGGNNGAGYFWVPTYSLVSDHDRTRAFWGCNDWHSAVGSTWVTVRLLRNSPKSPLAELAREKLNAHLGKANLDGELAFFRAAAAAINPIPSANQGGLFERPYGFVWLLKLQSELRTWPDTQARRWAGNIAPLAAWMADSLAPYFSKLVEPVRTGAQTNTALSMTLALDYADVAGDVRLSTALGSVARKFFLADTACATVNERVVPASSGRGGAGRGAGGGRAGGAGGRGGANTDSAARANNLPNDLTPAAGRGGRGAAPAGAGGGGAAIHSPCLTEAALMSRVLAPSAFATWVAAFLPPLQSGRFAPLTEPVPIPVDTVPASLATERARLVALSFARAQAMERIAHALPATDPRVAAWHRLSAIQADRGFELLRDDSAGTYWLPAQALLYFSARH